MDTQTKLEAETSNSNTSSLKNSQRSPSAAVNGEVQYLSQIVEKLDKDKRRSAWVNKPDALRRSISDLKELINDLAVSSGSDSSTLPHSMNSSTSLHPIIENESDNEWSEEEAPDTDEIVDIEHDGYSSSDEELQGKKKTPMVLKNTSELQATHFPTFATPQVGKAQRTPEKATKSNPRIAMLTRSESPNPKFNSTSTLFIQTTLAKPDLIEVLHCASKAIHFHLQKGEDKSEKVYFPLFDERTHPLMKEFDNKAEPTESDVFIFLKTIFEFQRMDVECVVMCVVYIERLLELTALTMDRTNWRRVSLGSIIVSSKVWEDLAVWNQDFLEVFHNSVTGRELHQLELQFLGLVQYRLAIPASTYAKYYFELRAFSHEDSKLPRRPIDKEGAAKLEARTNKTLKEKFQRRASSNDLAPMIQSRNAVLN